MCCWLRMSWVLWAAPDMAELTADFQRELHSSSLAHTMLEFACWHPRAIFPPLAPPPFQSQFTATVLSPHPYWTDRHLPMVCFPCASLQKQFPQTFSLCPSAMYTASEDTEYVKNHLSPEQNVLGKTTSNKNKTEGYASHPTWAQTFSRPNRGQWAHKSTGIWSLVSRTVHLGRRQRNEYTSTHVTY